MTRKLDKHLTCLVRGPSGKACDFLTLRMGPLISNSLSALIQRTVGLRHIFAKPFNTINGLAKITNYMIGYFKLILHFQDQFYLGIVYDTFFICYQSKFTTILLKIFVFCIRISTVYDVINVGLGIRIC